MTACEERGERSTFEVAVRIPFGTALSEELIFRGAVLALLERRHPPFAAAAITSALFGLWHVLPALDSIAANAPDRDAPADSLSTVAGTVMTTAAAGAAFAWLRRRSGSILAPAILHAAMNAGGFIAIRWQQRRSSSHAGR